MLKTLLKVHLLGLKNSYISRLSNKANQNGRKRNPYGLLVLLGVLLVVVIISLFGLFSSIAEAFVQLDIMWAYFVFFLISASALMLIGSVFMTKAFLFEARDNYLLLSLPIKASMILFSRIALLYIYNLIFETIIAIPVLIAYFTCGAANVVSVIAFLIMYLTLPLLILAISSVLAWLISLLTSRIRNKSLFSIIFYLLFFAVYFVFCFKSNEIISYLVLNSSAISDSLGKILPLMWFGKAISKPNFLYLAGFVAVYVGAFALMYFIIAKTYLKFITSNHGLKKLKYVEKDGKVSTPMSALVNREIKHICGIPTYFINGCFGAILLAIFAVASIYFAIAQNDFIDQMIIQLQSFGITLPINELGASIGILFICFLITTVLITPPSISVEGKTLWCLKSLPVSTKAILKSKLAFQIISTLPSALIASISLIFIFKPGFWIGFFTLIIPAIFSVFYAVVGLFEALRHPFFEWISVTQAVKNGLANLFSMLIGMFSVVLPVLIYFIFRSTITSPIIAVVSMTIILSLSTIFLYRYIVTKGVKIFDNY